MNISQHLDKPLNDIATTQNSDEQLEKLFAQRALYSEVKQLKGIHFFLTVIVAFALPVCVTFYPKANVWSVFLALVFLFIDLFFWDALQKEKRELAAKIQESFDCNLLEIQWNFIKAGSPPEGEIIAFHAAKGSKEPIEAQLLNNWYHPELSSIPMPVARLACMRTNLLWDSELRHRYAAWLKNTIFAMLVIFVGIAVAAGMSLEQFLAIILFPYTPLLSWATKECQENYAISNRQRSLKEYVENLWTEKLQKLNLGVKSDIQVRQLQDEIFDLRRSSPVLFDRVYFQFRQKNDSTMNRGVEFLIKEAKDTLISQKCKEE